MIRRGVAAVSATLLLVAGACGSSTPQLPDIESLKCPAPSPSVVTTATSLAAFARVAREERAPITGPIVHSGHGRGGPDPALTVSGATRAELAREIRAAADVACALRTTDDAQRAGYIESANFTQGVGTHWTNWSLIDKPFDPTRPAMLLYAPRLGETQLIGFSYWVRTSDPHGPSGFAGNADQWHRHFGMCFDATAMLQREDVRSARNCAGTWVNGSDMWMLHAWIVPGNPNAWGLFAALNPVLCSRKVADIERCPGLS